MVRDTNAEHVLAEEGSSSHPKRQPLSSLVEDEAETVQEAEGGENGEEGTVSSDRSRIMERVVEAVTVPCPTVKRGCTNKFSTSLMAKSWPMRRNVVLLYATVLHQTATTPACMNIRDRILFLQERIDGPLVAVQCFEEEQGVYVTVNCIAPCALRMSE
ncbi:hypothetical protein F2Q70_00045151 [Brassica cretica]|uniref:Uncharacterized protein n=1 Tax=Brassica cretica TaxID=69181 RepID=A0A8S9KF01_BRACR|nr:hypothetical protein F2Q70_00045151 [Brassica cretica]KAF3519529.1 hypothetical protein DY000_02063460 [Brassica cretica]